MMHVLNYLKNPKLQLSGLKFKKRNEDLTIKYLLIFNRTGRLASWLIAIGAGGLGIDSRADQIGRSVVSGSPLQRLALKAEMNPATRRRFSVMPRV